MGLPLTSNVPNAINYITPVFFLKAHIFLARAVSKTTQTVGRPSNPEIHQYAQLVPIDFLLCAVRPPQVPDCVVATVDLDQLWRQYMYFVSSPYIANNNN